MLMIEPPPALIMPGATACIAKKLMPDIRGNAFIEIISRHILPIMPIIASRVIYKHICGADLTCKRGKRFLQTIYIAQITRRMDHVFTQPLAQPRAGVCIHVHEADPRGLRRKGRNDFCADPGRATGHINRLAGKTGVVGKFACHINTPFREVTLAIGRDCPVGLEPLDAATLDLATLSRTLLE
jgi:hypothetical protein